MDITATKLEIIKAIAELESEVLIKKILALLPTVKRTFLEIDSINDTFL